MPFALSPGVTVVEKDFSSIIPAVSTSAGAMAGAFQWGPVMDPQTVTSEDVLVQLYGRPNDSNYTSFFTAANFLSYTNNLLVNRIDASGLRNATSLVSGSLQSIEVDSILTGENGGYKPGHNTTITISEPDVVGGTQATAEPVFGGASLEDAEVTITNAGSGYTVAPTIVISAPDIEGGTQATATCEIVDGAIDSVTIVEGGSGYFGPVTVTVEGTGEITIATPTSQLLSVRIVNPGSGYTSVPDVTIENENTGTLGSPTDPSLTAVIVESAGVKIKNLSDYTENFQDFSSNIYGMFAARYPGVAGNGITVLLVDTNVWNYASAANDTWSRLIKASFSASPGTSAQAARKGISNDNLHMLVLDSVDGKWSGTPYSVLEKYSFVSKLKGVTRSDGTNVYWADALTNSSKYVYAINTPTSSQIADPQNSDWNLHVDTVAYGANLRDLNSVPAPITLNGGSDDYSAQDAGIQTALDQFSNTDLYDVSLIVTGNANAATVNRAISIAETRRDCVAFFSPRNTDGSPIVGSGTTAVNAVKAFIDAVAYRSNYAVMDSGVKYQYDRYNDVYRWIPLNADVAGLCARTDYTNDPWFSPGGFNRGQVKNVVKLGFNPNQADRDALYSLAVNPVVTFPGQGTVLFGDKTFTMVPSAFDRINVRRLFIVLEKAIATAAKFQLFEFNDDFTRAQFRNLVEPFLRTVQGRRGIVDFRVRCDATNNPGDVIDRNEFVASIFIKPNRSINFITLNFVAARSSVNFDEIGG